MLGQDKYNPTNNNFLSIFFQAHKDAYTHVWIYVGFEYSKITPGEMN